MLNPVGFARDDFRIPRVRFATLGFDIEPRWGSQAKRPNNPEGQRCEAFLFNEIGVSQIVRV